MTHVGPLQSRLSPSGRTYTQPIDGGSYLSVTTALRTLDKSGPLVGWASRETARAAVRYYNRAHAAGEEWPSESEAIDAIKGGANRDRDAKGSRGTAVHDAIHELVTYGELGTPHAWEPDVLAHVDQYRRFVDDFRPIYVYAEVTTYNERVGYAGTCDLIAELPGIGLMVLDYKTGGVYGEAALQLAAYRHAEYLITGPPWERWPMPPTVGAAVLQLSEHKYDLIGVDTTAPVLDAFAHCVELANWRADHWSDLVGDVIVPPKRKPPQ